LKFKHYSGFGLTTSSVVGVPMQVARIYLRVSTDEQDLTRQEQIKLNTCASG
jgi:hypothetical protein